MLCVTVFFGVRMVMFSVYWSDPAHRDVEIEGWMTPGYVARSYRLPPDLIRNVLQLSPDQAPRQTLSDLARANNTTLDEMRAAILGAVAAQRLIMGMPPE